MPQFLIYCLDKPDHAEQRTEARSRHLDYARGNAHRLRLAGPILSETGAMIGSLFIGEFADIDDARTFNAADPYTQVDLWQSVDIRPMLIVIG